MKKFQLLVLGLIILFFTGCGVTSKINSMALLTGKTWILSSLEDGEFGLENFNSRLPTLNFLDGGRLAGFTGCNNFSGGFSMENTSMQLDPGAITKNVCPEIPEEKYLSILGKVNSFQIEKEKLILLDGGSKLMSFMVASH
jgi:heat shock protein HslJ